MKLILSNKSSALSTEKRNNYIRLKWNTNIGIVLYNQEYSRNLISNSFQENLKMYKSATFTLMLLSKLENSDIVSVSTNLISTDLFNPSGSIFLINTERAVAYLNKTFLVKRVTLNDVYIDGIHFDFEFRVTKNKTLILPDILDFQICIDFYES